MIGDPLTIENGGTDISAPRVVSTNPFSGKFSYQDESNGAIRAFEFIQNGNATRSRHVVKFTGINPADADGYRPSLSMTLTIDEPSDGAFSNADVLAFFNTNFKGTLTDAIIGKLLNGEV